MKIHSYAIRLDRPLRTEEVDRLIAQMPPERQARLQKEEKPELRDEALCAYAVLSMALHELYGWERLPEITYNGFGKPFFTDRPEVQFSISYTRGAAFVAVHDQPLGADIERLRPISERSMERIAGVSTAQAFFESWVRRESRSKCSGNGIATMSEENAPILRGEHFFFIDTFDGYAACICTHAEALPAEVVRMHLD